MNKTIPPIPLKSISFKTIRPQIGAVKAPFIKPIYNDVKANLNGVRPCTFVTHKLSDSEIFTISNAFETARKSCLKGLSTTKGMNFKDREKLCKPLGQTDSDVFALVSLGEKPSMVVSEKGIAALQSINVKGFDTLLRTKRPQEQIVTDNLFFFNRTATQEIIEKNKDFYTKRLDLPKGTTKEDIYNLLLSPKSPLLNEKGFSDIIGMTFGYPKKNSMIYQLESNIENLTKKRENLNEYKKELKTFLRSDSSPYKNFNENFKKSLEKAIDKISKIEFSSEIFLKDKKLNSYPFIKYVNENCEIKRISDSYRNAAKKLKKIDDENRIKKFLNSVESQKSDYQAALKAYWG